MQLKYIIRTKNMKLIKRKIKKETQQEIEFFDIATLVSNWDSEIIPSIKNSHYKMQKNAKELGYPYQATLDDFIKYTNANNKTKEYMDKYFNSRIETIQTLLDITSLPKSQTTLETYLEK